MLQEQDSVPDSGECPPFLLDWNKEAEYNQLIGNQSHKMKKKMCSGWEGHCFQNKSSRSFS